MLIGVPLQTVPGETGLAVTPENAKQRRAQGSTPRLPSGAGVAASAADEAHAVRTTR
jgi:NAD(P) transhydrogenase subunit alpha